MNFNIQTYEDLWKASSPSLDEEFNIRIMYAFVFILPLLCHIFRHSKHKVYSTVYLSWLWGATQLQEESTELNT